MPREAKLQELGGRLDACFETGEADLHEERKRAHELIGQFLSSEQAPEASRELEDGRTYEAFPLKSIVEAVRSSGRLMAEWKARFLNRHDLAPNQIITSDERVGQNKSSRMREIIEEMGMSSYVESLRADEQDRLLRNVYERMLWEFIDI